MTTRRRTILGAGLAAAATLALALPGVAEPLKIRVGHGTAVEEQVWMLAAMPEAAPNKGTAYDVEMAQFPGTDKRFQAFEAGAIDIATGSANSVLFAASEGVEFKIIASLSRESPQGFYTIYMVRDDSDIRSVADLKGKTIGINGFRSSTHLWAIKALTQAGLDPDADVTFAPVRFPAQAEALRAGTIDVGVFPQPFARLAEAEGGVRPLFTSKDAVPFEEELMLLVAKPAFLEANGDAVRAFLADVVNATEIYLDRPDDARTALVESGMTRIPLQAYLGMNDYHRDRGARVDLQALDKMQEMQIELGWQRNRVDIPAVVDMTYLPQ